MLVSSTSNSGPPFPVTQSAIICASGSKSIDTTSNLTISDNCPLPLPLAPDQVLVRTVAVAVNPCDWKMPDNFPSKGAVGGSDFAGIIVALGSGVQEEAELSDSHRDLSIGDRVCGAVHGFNPVNHSGGCFAEYVAATAEILLKIPEGVSWENAAAVGGTGIATLGIVFYEHLKLGFSPRNRATEADSAPVLVYGGGTATGTMAIQLLRASGLRPLAVCSPKSTALALSYGAEITFDYNSPTCAAEIREYTKGRLKHIIDIIADSISIPLCYSAMGRLGGTYVGLEMLPKKMPNRQLIQASWVMGQTIFGKELQLSGGYGRPAVPSHRELGRRWFAEVEALWHEGKIVSHPVKIGPERGLDAVVGGIHLKRQGRVAGEKQVFFI